MNVGFNIFTNSSGSFSDYGVTTPYEDGPGASGHYFNVGLDLGVIFNPSSNQGQSPVFIDVTFDQPVSCLVFDISDIDISGSNRRDRVVVTSNNGSVIPSLSVVSSDPTVSVSNNVASAIGGNSGASNIGVADAGTENGNVIVDFGTAFNSNVRVNYREISGVNNPAGRDIGLFGNFSFCPPSLLPLKLLAFESSDRNQDCMAELMWKTAEESNLQHYQLSFSTEGDSFDPIGTIPAQSGNALKEYYFESTNRIAGYYQLSEVTLDSRRNILAIDHFQPDCSSSNLSMIYPNPVVNQHVTWHLNSLDNTHLTILEIFE